MLKSQNLIKKSVRKTLGLISPKLLASVDVYRDMGYWIDWKNPKDLNEKILWLSLNSDTSKWTELADKYAVRQYLSDLGYGDLLPKLYGVWDNADDIDFDALPNTFILKTNHGSGTNIIVRNKSELNISETREKLNQWLRLKFGWPYEPHYLKITPKIIAEQLLDITKQSIKTTSLIDYKLFCLGGHVDLIWSCYNRTDSSVYVDTHKPDWSYHPELSVFSDQYRDGNNLVPPPINLEKMVRISERLSKDFSQVRIDYYEVDGKLYFGEMTFTSNSGTMTFFTRECLLNMGAKVTLSPTEKNKNE